MHTTKVVTNYNPMAFLLSRRIINRNYAHYINIIQEFDLVFFTPKSNKGLYLAKFIFEFPTSAPDLPVNDELLDEHLFSITSDDPWYGNILTYFQIHKFAPHLNLDDRRYIPHQYPRYLLIGDDLYCRSVKIVLHHCLTHDEVDKVLNVCHGGACGSHLRMATTQKIMHINYFWPSLFSDCIEVVKHYPNCKLYTIKAQAPPSPLHLVIAAIPFCKWVVNFRSVNPDLLLTISILSWSSTISPNGLNPCPCSITLQLLHPSSSLTMLSLNLGFRNNWFQTMDDTLKMRYRISYLLCWALNTNIHRLTTPKEMAKLKMSIKSLKICFSGW